MQEGSFAQFMRGQGLSEKTIAQRGYALKRIERIQDVDLDAEYERDGLASLMRLFAYSSADARASRANPTKMDIDSDKLHTHLAWYKSHLTAYARFRSGGDGVVIATTQEEDVAEELIGEVVGKTFSLERDLQTALRGNISQLETGLEVIDGGSERRVEGGFIDILARDSRGVLTVIELKAETARPESVAQLLAYMGCIAEEAGEMVRGILVAGDHHPRVKLAARAVPNLELRKYRYRFDFE
jgi:hypothetical protein